MSAGKMTTIDANEAVAHVAYHTNEVIAIYPITPASAMGEAADAWAAAGKPNVWGVVPQVIEMQSEAGAAGTAHGALQTGGLTTTFTASQGLLLMIPNMYKIAGELTPAVFHVAARAIATHALSIFGDHSDVMAVRQCGWAMLSADSVQQAQDFALIAQAATLRSRVPFLHFFDGFRTSHEVNKIEQLSQETLLAMLKPEDIAAHRQRSLDPARPVLRGTAQNPDVFFQAREAANRFYLAVPKIVRECMHEFGQLTGRWYQPFSYVGALDAERVIVVMGSGAGAIQEAVEALNRQGQRVGMIVVHLYRPFDTEAFLQLLPLTTRRLAVLDRTKEPGSVGEPLYLDVLAALAEGRQATGSATVVPPITQVLGGRYGLASKEFTPAMVMAIFEHLQGDASQPHFTIGITDDVTHLSLPYNPTAYREPNHVKRALFYGLGSDGTVGASKNTVKIIGENTPLYAQGYSVYDSKKAGAVTVSHLRFSPEPIRATYLIDQADFVSCSQFQLLQRMDVLGRAQQGATVLLNAPYAAQDVWQQLPIEVQQQILARELRVFVVDAYRVAREAGLGGRINTIMQTGFFLLSAVLDRDSALAEIKKSIQATYGKRGQSVVGKNLAAVDATLTEIQPLPLGATADSVVRRLPAVPAAAPDFVQRVTALMISGHGDLLPVSALPVDGTYPTGTAKYEKRSIAESIPIWQPELCIDCGLCSFVCPHAAIRMQVMRPEHLQGAPESFANKSCSGKQFPGMQLTIQVAPDDCTGCGVCVDVCPAKSKEAVKVKAINMQPKLPHLERERVNWDFFLKLPQHNPTTVATDTIKGTQLLEPLFEFSGACAGCGETPYLKLLSQLFGDRAVIANATGCSSIFGGNLPTTPWSTNAAGAGPAWSNSLFEDNAEFGLGLRLALDQKLVMATALLPSVAASVGESLVEELRAGSLPTADRSAEALERQRERIRLLKERLHAEPYSTAATTLLALADVFLPRSVWIVGGDGWAYDIGFSGVDHVLSTGLDVNILVLDTGVYSNTGGQSSKSTPRGAIAKFASGGKSIRRKDLGMVAVNYGNVYVAQIAMGANPAQALKAFREAESYRGPSVILAYSHCIAHGIEMSTSMTHQKEATRSGFWPLYRHDPRLAHDHGHPFQLDSHAPTLPFREFAQQEGRFAMLLRSHPDQARTLFELAQRDIDDQWNYYQQLAKVERAVSELGANGEH